MNAIVAVTGSIAAYKAAVLVRELRKRDISVRVLMTPCAKNFISPLTMATLSGNPVAVENFSAENGSWNSHISLGVWADLLIVAPATANTLAKMASGIADNLVLDTCLSSRAPIWVAPAMDVDMYANPATQKNIETLRSRGVRVLDPGEGFLASGLTGKGRMAEPEDIARAVEEFFRPSGKLKGKKILVTLGATRENIDPVRFISNYSTGKMGVSIIRSLLSRGAEVIAVTGKVDVEIPESTSLKRVDALSAVDMLEACKNYFPSVDCAIFSAAVADYRPEAASQTKIKRDGKPLTLTMVPNPDIALEMGKIKQPGQYTVGFALESSSDAKLAAEKLDRKNFDAIVFNSLSDSGAGFGCDTNKVSIISKEGTCPFPLKGKDDVAEDIINFVENHMN